MTNHKIQFVGSPCGQHGNYTFYKAFRYSLHGKQRILALGEFFFVKLKEEEDIISIGEAQLMWEDRASGQILVSLRLYFLPENTPEGRTEENGEHEVILLAEKNILRAEDIINIMRAASGVKWDVGLTGVYGPLPPDGPYGQHDSSHYCSPISRALDIKEIMREKRLIGDIIEPNTLHIIILHYDRYCRIRGLLKRLEGVEEDFMKSSIVIAMGGFLVPSRKTKLLFCRDVFEYPELEGHELLCNHMAPKLQGRPRKKKRRRADSETDSEDGLDDHIKPKVKGKPAFTSRSILHSSDKKVRTTSLLSHAKSPKSLSQVKNEISTPALNRFIEYDFMTKLYKFMSSRNTPITRLPHVGVKRLNVFGFFTRVQQLGGYESVCNKKLWKLLYDEMAGAYSASNSSSAQCIQNAGVIRRHYERLLLPYEKYLLMQQKKRFNIDNSSLKKKEIKKEVNSERGGEPSVSILQKDSVESDGGDGDKKDGEFVVPRPITTSPGKSSICKPSSPVDTSDTNVTSSYTVDSTSGTPFQLMVPKVPLKREKDTEEALLHADLAKRPEITITPIPRMIGDGATYPSSGGKDLQLSDLMKLDNSIKPSFGVSALQGLAKIAGRYDKLPAETGYKKIKHENSRGALVNGIHQRMPGISIEVKGANSPSPPSELTSSKSLQVPELLPANLLRQMVDPKLLSSYHVKTMADIAALLPQTSIYPTPVPEAPKAHQQTKSPQKPPVVDTTRPEFPRGFSSQSVYSQSKNIYGKPTSGVSIEEKDRRASPEIEILDLSRPANSRNLKPPKNDKLEIELLDLSSRKDITVSAIPRAAVSKPGSYHRASSPQVTIRSADITVSPINYNGDTISLQNPPTNSPAAALVAAAAQSLTNMGLSSPSMVPYIIPPGNMKSGTPSSNVNTVPIFPYLDPNALASYYSSLLNSSVIQSNSSSTLPSSNNSSPVNSSMAAAAQLAQLNPLCLTALPPEFLANLGGLYKSLLPQGSLPPPHFLAGLMSPGSSNPPTSK